MESYTNILLSDDTTLGELNSIMLEKENIYKDIASFNAKSVNIDDIKYNKTIKVVSKHTKKGLFRTKVSYDTISQTYCDISNALYALEYSKIVKYNSTKMNNLIRHNNELTLEMKLIIDNYANKKIIRNFQENEKLLTDLKENTKVYIIISFLLVITIALLLYLLVLDIRKINNSNNRNNYIVSILMDKTKELLSKNEK